MKNRAAKKGFITFQTILMIASPFIAVTGAFYSSRSSMTASIYESEKELVSRISDNELIINQNRVNIDNISDDINEIKKQNEKIINLLLN